MARKHNEWKARVKERFPNARFRPGRDNDVAYIVENGKEFAVGRYRYDTDEGDVMSEEAFKERHKNKDKTGASVLHKTYASATRRMEIADVASIVNKKYGYKPYKGGAGPDEATIKRNNEALKKALEDCGIKVKMTESDITGEVMMEPKKGTWVTYDRWGYGSDGNIEIDQLDLYQTLVKLCGKAKANSLGR